MQYAEARARLAEEARNGEGGLGSMMQSSLDQSDLFFDCVDGSEDPGERSKYAEPQECDTTKVRVRVAGLDVTLCLSEAPLSSREIERREVPYMEVEMGNDTVARRLHVQLRRMTKTVHHVGSRIDAVAEIGTCVADYYDTDLGTKQPLRVAEVLCEAQALPSLKVTCSNGPRTSAPRRAVETDEVNISVDVQCLPVAAVIHSRMLGFITKFLECAAPRVQPVESISEKTAHGGSINAATPGKESDKCVRVTVSISRIDLRLPSHPCVCSSEAYAALVQSVHNGASPVGWTVTEVPEVLRDQAPLLVVEIEGAVIEHTTRRASSPTCTVECTKLRCQMALPLSDSDSEAAGASLMELHFLEAVQPPGSPFNVPLKVEYGLAEDIVKAGRLEVVRPGDANLKFLHTWEPNEG